MTPRALQKEGLRRVERLRRKGCIEEALAAVEALSEALPDDGRVALEWARTLHGWADAPAAALVQVDRALALAPGLHSARFERALLRLKTGDAGGAVEDLDALEVAGHRHPELLHMQRARALEALGDLEGALVAWVTAGRGRPSSMWVSWQRGRLALRAAHPQEAVRAFTEAVEVANAGGERPDPELLLDLAEAQRVLLVPEQARVTLELARAALWPEERAIRGRLERLERELLRSGAAPLPDPRHGKTEREDLSPGTSEVPARVGRDDSADR